MLCPICQSPMSPMFTSVVCPNNCDQRQIIVAEALYNASLEVANLSAIWGAPWDELEEEAKQFFIKLAGVAIKAFNP